MFSLKIVLVAALASYASATTYAQFWDDDSCTVNGGESVSVDNPGCLNESGRKAISFHDVNVQQVALVASPSPDCPCQFACQDSVLDCDGGVLCENYGCHALKNEALSAQSFRFIGGFCDDNNC